MSFGFTWEGVPENILLGLCTFNMWLKPQLSLYSKYGSLLLSLSVSVIDLKCGLGSSPALNLFQV